MRRLHILLLAGVLLNLLTGCVSPQPNSEFVKTVTFSSLETFTYKHTLVTGMDFRKSEEYLLEDLSEETIVSELEARGFELSDNDADFFAVVKWKKAVSAYASPFDHIDPYRNVMARRDNPASIYASRVHLTLEIYESSTQDLFWRKDMPNIFDAIQMTEGRIIASLKESIKNFPDRIVKDPSLPDIE